MNVVVAFSAVVDRLHVAKSCDEHDGAVHFPRIEVFSAEAHSFSTPVVAISVWYI